MSGKDKIDDALQAAMGTAGVGIVEKKVFSMQSYTTLGGKAIHNVQIGYETYGKLNERRDNAILIAHYFSGTSHAAGRYAHTDAEPGYWDAIIGPGKAIDTDRYFVISADTLANLNTKDSHAVTTGPASIDPDTGKPYGMAFPIVTIRDFVNVQKALVDALGIRALHAVAGPSMGSMQAIEWAVAFPEMVKRVIAVIPAGLQADPYLIGLLNVWTAPIRLDPHWNRGDYYGRQEPLDGLAAALKTILLTGRHPGWANAACHLSASNQSRDALRDFSHVHAIEATLDQASRVRARTVDANALLYTAKACQLFSLGHQGNVLEAVRTIQAKLMIVPATSDLLMLPSYAQRASDVLRSCGMDVSYSELAGDGGHFDGLLKIADVSQKLKVFIDY